MAITSEQIKAFLKKRGYEAEAQVISGDTYLISLHVNSVDEVAKVFANISEPGRFIVSVHLDDILKILVDDSGISSELRQLKTADVMMLSQAETYANSKVSALEAVLKQRIREQLEQNALLAKDIAIVKKTPWWKKW